MKRSIHLILNVNIPNPYSLFSVKLCCGGTCTFMYTCVSVFFIKYKFARISKLAEEKKWEDKVDMWFYY